MWDVINLQVTIPINRIQDLQERAIFSLVERGGHVRSFHVDSVTAKTLKPIMHNQIAQDTHIVTDDFKSYCGLDKELKNHDTIRHSTGEYVRGKIHTNTIEGYFSILKRVLVGTFHYVGANHLKRYIGEFDFRYNNRKISDSERAEFVLIGIEGKGLFYIGTHKYV